MTFSRRLLLASWLLLTPAAAAQQPPAVKAPSKGANDGAPATDDELAWIDARSLRVEGQGWQETSAPYDRLPAKAEGVVRDAVWNLSRHSAGIAIEFIANATAIHTRWKLTSPRLALPHMPATGVSGLDLYVLDDGDWKWLACTRPTSQSQTATIVSGLPPGQRTYRIYLPLYNGVESLEIGVPAGATIDSAAPRPVERRKPLVFYGTSITQGACAARPGMAHPAILGRWLNRPIINQGYSGNGRMETEVAQAIAEIDAAAYVIDCLPNLKPAEVLARTKPCIEALRRTRPTTPILLVEDRSYSDGFLIAAKREKNRGNRAALRKRYEELKAAGDEHLYYLPGEQLLGSDNEGTVDSSHPTDLGFWRQAEVMARALEAILADGRP